MKVIVIGNAGTGKSRFTRQLHAATGWPVLALDQVWHAMDYSHAAKLKFAQRQRQFMAQPSWVIDGNYRGTLPLRLAQADVIICLQCPRWLSVLRVIRRSLRFRRDPSTRPDMAPGFREHFDRAYLDFLRYVWQYPRRFDATIAPLLAQRRPEQVLLVASNQREKKRLVAQLTKGGASWG